MENSTVVAKLSDFESMTLLGGGFSLNDVMGVALNYRENVVKIASNLHNIKAGAFWHDCLYRN